MGSLPGSLHAKTHGGGGRTPAGVKAGAVAARPSGVNAGAGRSEARKRVPSRMWIRATPAPSVRPRQHRVPANAELTESLHTRSSPPGSRPRPGARFAELPGSIAAALPARV